MQLTLFFIVFGIDKKCLICPKMVSIVKVTLQWPHWPYWPQCPHMATGVSNGLSNLNWPHWPQMA